MNAPSFSPRLIPSMHGVRGRAMVDSMLLHASCVSLNGQGVLLTGPSGHGKSDLALRLIDVGAQLVADDQVLLSIANNKLVATPPDSIAGMLEIRHLGLFHVPYRQSVEIFLCVELVLDVASLERVPSSQSVFLLDHSVQRLRLSPFEASTPAKIRAFLTYTGIE